MKSSGSLAMFAAIRRRLGGRPVNHDPDCKQNQGDHAQEQVCRQQRDKRARRPILRHRGRSLSAELRLIGTAVACGHVERLPHPPTPQVAQRIVERGRPPATSLVIWSPVP